MIKSLIQSMIVCPDMDRLYPKITHGKGVFLYDQSGRRYLDASSGSCGVSNFGHGNEEIGEVIKQQVIKASVLPTHYFSSSIVEEYLDELVKFASGKFQKAWTVMSGTEGVENAIKLSLQYHQLRGDHKRFKIISRWYTYHGNSIFTLDVGGMKYRRESYNQWLNNFPHVSPAYSYRKPNELSEKEFVDGLVREFEECLVKTGPETVAAFIAEPIVAAALGAVPPPDRYFEQIKDICHKYEILFVADEILTGFGRTSTRFGMEHYNVAPDIMAVGKGMSGGYYPLSAVIASEKVVEVFKATKSPFLGGHTFACNPVGAAVGKYTINYLKTNRILENTKAMGEVLKSGLEKLLKYNIVGDVRGEGLMLGIELVANKSSKIPFPRHVNVAKMIGEKALSKGVILYPGGGSFDGVLGDHILITPPLTINRNEVAEILHTLEASILEVQNNLISVNS